MNKHSFNGMKSRTGCWQYQRITISPHNLLRMFNLNLTKQKMRKNEISMNHIYKEGIKHWHGSILKLTHSNYSYSVGTSSLTLSIIFRELSTLYTLKTIDSKICTKRFVPFRLQMDGNQYSQVMKITESEAKQKEISSEIHQRSMIHAKTTERQIPWRHTFIWTEVQHNLPRPSLRGLAYFEYKAQVTNRPTKNDHIYKMHGTFCLIHNTIRWCFTDI